MKNFYKNTTINSRYSLNQFLGVGVFGEVWSSHDNILDMDVAIKLYTSSDESSISKLQQEYKNAYNLSHENILSPKHFDVTEGCPFMIYSLCKAGSIRKMTGNINEKNVWAIIHDVSQGLQEIHRHAITHNNLKPENILIKDNGSYVISDMALSKSTRATMSKESIDRYTSAIAYKAPETQSGKNASEKSDIWSLGIIAFELIMGHLPNNSELSDKDIPLSTKGVSRLLCDTIFSCLSYDESVRPSAKQLYDLSVKVLNGEIVSSISNNNKNQNTPHLKRTQHEGIQPTNHEKRLVPRNWFVTFYLWGLMLSSLVLLILRYLAGFDNLSKLSSSKEISDYDVDYLYVDEFFITGFMLSIKLLGEIMLLKKIRVGYTISSSALFCVAYAILKFGKEFELPTLFAAFAITIIYMLLLWIVLLIRKDGFSQWETMLRNVNLSQNKWIVWCVASFTSFFLFCEFLTL